MRRRRAQFSLKQNQRKKSTPLTATNRRLFKLSSKVRDRRKKKHKRSRVTKRPGFRRGAKQLILSRQLVRKLRAVQRAATRTLRRRVLRSKRRHYRKARTRFNAIHYLRRLRVKRRTARRVQRYIHSTATILRGARAKILQRRTLSRSRRATYFQLKRESHLLLSTHPVTGLQQLRRQQLLARRERHRHLRAVRLLAGRTVNAPKTASNRN